MGDNALARLRAENPLSEPLPALPLETLRRLLDHEPADGRVTAPRRQPFARRRPVARRASVQLVAATCAAAAIALVVVGSLPGSDSGAGFSIPQAKAAIARGEQQLRRSARPVFFTKVGFSFRTPGRPAVRMVQRMWQGDDQWRASTTSPVHGMTDVAMLGGITAYYVPRRRTVYLNRAGQGGSAVPSMSGGIPDPDPVELAIGALLNVEPAGASESGSSFPQVVKELMAIPGAHTARRAGLVTTTVTRGGHFTRIIARAGSLAAVAITQSRPDSHRAHARYSSSFRFFAYRRRLSPAGAARAFDLLRVYPHAKVDITHRTVLRIP